MLIYVLLYLLIIFGSYVIYKGSKQKNRNRNVAVFCSASIITVLALRHPSMGIDLHYGEQIGYLFSYHDIAEMPWSKVFGDPYLNYEKGYVIFNKLLHYVFPHEQFLLIACALLSIIPVCVFLYRNSLSMRMSLIIYMALPIFTFVFSGLRQAIAIGIACIAIKLAYERKLLKFVVAVSIALLFHITSIFLLVMYPLMNIKFKMFHRWLSLVLLGGIFVFKAQIFKIGVALIGKNAKPDNNGAVTFFLILTAIYVVCFMFSDRTRKTEGFLNLLFVACAIQAMGGVHNTVGRGAYYFMPVIAVLIPNIVMRIKPAFERKCVKVGVTAVFVSYGLFSLANTYWAMANPYHFFWEVI